jgi:predicted nuclease of predicted toxin-antitoxin system
MSVALYMDVHVNRAVTDGLRRRGVDVLTAQEDGMSRTPDPVLLDRALSLNRVVFTQDADFLAEANRRQLVGEPFAGVIYAHQQGPSVGTCVNDLELIAGVFDPVDTANQVVYLPL